MRTTGLDESTRCSEHSDDAKDNKTSSLAPLCLSAHPSTETYIRQAAISQRCLCLCSGWLHAILMAIKSTITTVPDNPMTNTSSLSAPVFFLIRQLTLKSGQKVKSSPSSSDDYFKDCASRDSVPLTAVHASFIFCGSIAHYRKLQHKYTISYTRLQKLGNKLVVLKQRYYTGLCFELCYLYHTTESLVVVCTEVQSSHSVKKRW